MKICMHCNQENPDNSQYCRHCGARLPETQPNGDVSAGDSLQQENAVVSSAAEQQTSAPSVTVGPVSPQTNLPPTGAPPVPIEFHPEAHTKTVWLRKRLKERWWSLPGLIVGIASIIVGIDALNTYAWFFVRDAEFGADFYTYTYNALQELVRGIDAAVEYLYTGIGLGLIFFGLFLVVRFIEKFFKDDNRQGG